MQLHQALRVYSPHLDGCKVDTSRLSSSKKCCTESTTPKRVWQGALLQCHPRWMHQSTYIPLHGHRKTICPRTHPSPHSRNRPTSPQMLLHQHAVKHTQHRRVVATTNQWPPNWLPLATTKPRKVGLIECGRGNICGATSLNRSAWSQLHPAWSNCSKQQSGGPTDCHLLQLEHVECNSLHVNGQHLWQGGPVSTLQTWVGSWTDGLPAFMQRNVSALVHSPWVALE